MNKKAAIYATLAILGVAGLVFLGFVVPKALIFLIMLIGIGMTWACFYHAFDNR